MPFFILPMFFLTERGTFTAAMLLDLKRMDVILTLLKQQLQNITDGPGSVSQLSQLEANISESKVQFLPVLGIYMCSES